MEGVQYCNSCQRLFRGEVSFSDYTWWELEMRFTHHNDLEEFKSALDLPCALCWLAWAHQDLSLIFQRGKFRRIRGRLIDKKLFFWTLKGKRRIHSESLNFSPCDGTFLTCNSFMPLSLSSNDKVQFQIQSPKAFRPIQGRGRR
jgi:hypothetical protein